MISLFSRKAVANVTFRFAIRRYFLTQTKLMKNDDLVTQRARLLYQSKKRGILENDIIIGDFAEQNLAKFNQEQLDAYDKIINGEHMEWDLFYYVSGKKSPPKDLQDCSVFKLMVQCVRNKKL